MLVIQTSRGDGYLTFNRRPGYRAPLLATSLDRSYLAFCSEEDLHVVLERVAGMPEP